jgi:valyl-tRNA synthetase
MPMEKTFDAATAEARISALWDAAGAFRAGANARPGAPPFSIMIPPPNVTGALHIGHALNNTVQDILARWHRMQGDDVLWQPGQDHAGIATQLVVERQLAASHNIRRQDLGRADFLAKIWEWKAESGGTIINQLQRLGASCDWSRNAFTMSGAPDAPPGEGGNFHDAVIKVFVDLHNKGLIYRGKRLVNWDPHFETAISDLEVENTETPGHMWHFKYPLAGGATYTYVEKDADGQVILSEERNYISIATTRPETMLGDGAVAVHPSDARYAPIVGMLCEIPVGPREHRRLIPIITDEYPDPTFGSGAVKITGAHDFNDYAVAQRNGIPLYRLMDTRAQMRSDGAPYAEVAARAQALSRAWLVRKGYATAGFAEQPLHLSEAEVDALNLVPDDLRGLDRMAARKAVVAQIDAEGGMIKVEDKPIMQPFGDRSKVVIEPMLTDQWFVDTAKIVQPAIDAVRDGRTVIMPESGEKTYFHWLENIEPWCISRQLWWGHQIPVWYGPSVEELDAHPAIYHGLPKSFCAASFEEAQAKAAEYYPNGTDIKEFVATGSARAYGFGRSGDTWRIELQRDPDVLDTWFSSGLWPIGTLGWPEQTPELKRYFPTSVLVTGQDILFFWVARMMMMQLAVVDDIPFKHVYLHGLVRDEKGEKMSKTKGNVIDPLTVIDEFGADALRLTLAQLAVLGGSPKLSPDKIKGNRNFGTKLWNAHRFAEMNGVFEGPRADGIPNASATVNKWIIGEVARARLAVDDALANWRINDAAQSLYAFVWGVVCDWYVEFAKPLLFEGAPERAETQAVMGWVLDQCLILLHPFTPFITEELWQSTGVPRAKLCAHADWPTYGLERVDAGAESELRWAIALIEGVRSVRAQMNVPVGLQVPLVMLSADESARRAWAGNHVLIQRLARISSLTESATAPKGALSVTAPGAAFVLPLADVIDVAAEKARVARALDKLGKEIAGLNGRLSNPNFAASAPAAVVAEAQGNLALRREEAAQLQAALDRLSEMG